MIDPQDDFHSFLGICDTIGIGAGYIRRQIAIMVEKMQQSDISDVDKQIGKFIPELANLL